MRIILFFIMMCVSINSRATSYYIDDGYRNYSGPFSHWYFKVNKVVGSNLKIEGTEYFWVHTKDSKFVIPDKQVYLGIGSEATYTSKNNLIGLLRENEGVLGGFKEGSSINLDEGKPVDFKTHSSVKHMVKCG